MKGDNLIFKWFDTQTGEPIDKISDRVEEQVPTGTYSGNYNAKIVPCILEGPTVVRVDQPVTEEYAKEGYKKLLVVGGDGTLNEVVNGLYTDEKLMNSAVIAMIPYGTGNDWCRMHGKALDVNTSNQNIKNENVGVQDIGVLEYIENGQNWKRYFINSAGTGYESVIGRRTNALKEQNKKGGPVLYLYALFNKFCITCLIRVSSIAIVGRVSETSVISETPFSANI